jgi:hypothetical protein
MAMFKINKTKLYHKRDEPVFTKKVRLVRAQPKEPNFDELMRYPQVPYA